MKKVYSIFAIGINHSSVDLQERSSLSFDNEFYQKFADSCDGKQIDSIVFLNTCNRSEIYGFGNLDQAQANYENLLPKSFNREKILVKSGSSAVNHLFKVASGLDSQLVGDLEILGQFKKAFKNSKEDGKLSGYMERLANTCIHAAKEIRSHTQLTSGTTSLSYAAVQLILENKISEDKKILIIGLGKFGKSIAKNLNTYFPKNDLTICNRTIVKAQDLSEEIGCNILSFDSLKESITNYDVIISAIDSRSFKINPSYFELDSDDKILIDLSVPSLFERSLKEKKGVLLYTIDDATEIINKSLETRKASIPLAENIMLQYIHEFMEWSKIHENSNSIQHWKSMVESASATCPHLQNLTEDQRNSYVNKSVGNFAKYIKNNIEEPSIDSLVKNYLDHEALGLCVLNCSTTDLSHNKACESCQKL